MLFRYATVRNHSDRTPTPVEEEWDDFAARFATPEIGLKDGPAFLPITLHARGGRTAAAVETITALVLDVDGKVHEDEIPDWLSDWPWLGLAHSSYSHAIGKAHFRLILPLSSPITPERYARLWQWAFKNSRGTIDPSGKSPAKLWYYPRVPDEASLAIWFSALRPGPPIDATICEVPEADRLTQDMAQVEQAANDAERTGSRNRAGYDLVRRLWRNGRTVQEIHAVGESYVRVVGGLKDHPYTIDEFEESVRQVAAHPPKIPVPGEYPFRDVGDLVLSRFPHIATDKDALFEYADNTHWVESSPKRLAALVEEIGPPAKAKDVNEAVNYIQRNCRDGHTSPPWNAIGDHDVAFENGVLDLESMAVRSHRMADRIDRVVPFEWDPSAQCSTWNRCLERWFHGDEDAEAKRAALQEYFGYILMAHNDLKRALFLYGDSDTGKSRCADAAVAMVGKAATATVPLDHMHDPRKVAPIRGKALNICSEVDAKGLLQDGGFKAIVAGDPIHLDPKYERPELYRPTCKLLVVTNTLPRVSDLSAAVYRRLLVIRFERQIPHDEQDVRLGAKLQTERSGIAAWAVLGAQRLAAQGGRFTEVPSSVELVRSYRAEQNPVDEFLEEACVEAPGEHVSTAVLCAAYERWSRTRCSVVHFGRMLSAAGLATERFRVGTRRLAGLKDIRLVDFSE